MSLVSPEIQKIIEKMFSFDTVGIDRGSVKTLKSNEYVNSITMAEARQLTEQIAIQNPTFAAQNACGHVMNGLAAANSALWLAAGLTVPTVAGAVVTGTAGIVTSGIIGVAGVYC